MNRFQRRLFWWSTGLTALTGGVYAWMIHFMEPVNEWAVVNHPWQPLVLKAHILVAPVMLFAVGLITVNHIWALYRAKLPRGRSTGIWAAVIFGPMALSGYLIQSITWPRLLAAVSWTHLILGLGVTALLVGHHLAVHKGIRRRKGSLRVVQVTTVAEPEGIQAPAGD